MIVKPGFSGFFEGGGPGDAMGATRARIEKLAIR